MEIEKKRLVSSDEHDSVWDGLEHCIKALHGHERRIQNLEKKCRRAKK